MQPARGPRSIVRKTDGLPLRTAPVSLFGGSSFGAQSAADAERNRSIVKLRKDLQQQTRTTGALDAPAAAGGARPFGSGARSAPRSGESSTSRPASSASSRHNSVTSLTAGGLASARNGQQGKSSGRAGVTSGPIRGARNKPPTVTDRLVGRPGTAGGSAAADMAARGGLPRVALLGAQKSGSQKVSARERWVGGWRGWG